METGHSLDPRDTLHEDVTACLFAICNALDASGTIGKAALREAFQERLLTCAEENATRPDGRFLILRALAQMPEQNELRDPSRRPRG